MVLESLVLESHEVHWAEPSLTYPQQPPASSQSSASHSLATLVQKRSDSESRAEASPELGRPRELLPLSRQEADDFWATVEGLLLLLSNRLWRWHYQSVAPWQEG